MAQIGHEKLNAFFTSKRYSLEELANNFFPFLPGEKQTYDYPRDLVEGEINKDRMNPILIEALLWATARGITHDCELVNLPHTAVEAKIGHQTNTASRLRHERVLIRTGPTEKWELLSTT